MVQDGRPSYNPLAISSHLSLNVFPQYFANGNQIFSLEFRNAKYIAQRVTQVKDRNGRVPLGGVSHHKRANKWGKYGRRLASYLERYMNLFQTDLHLFEKGVNMLHCMNASSFSK